MNQNFEHRINDGSKLRIGLETAFVSY